MFFVFWDETILESAFERICFDVTRNMVDNLQADAMFMSLVCKFKRGWMSV